MKTIKMIGYAGIASAALALLVPTMSITESAQARTTSEESSASVVHRVSHTLAADTKYTASVSSGYKWGQKIEAVKSDVTWAGAEEPQSGYKWGKSSANVNLSSSSSYAEQAGNPWGRRDFSEQAGNPWGRRDFSEQAGNPWGRRDFSEQAGNPWGRRDFSEQAGNPLGSSNFSEQAGNPGVVETSPSKREIPGVVAKKGELSIDTFGFFDSQMPAGAAFPQRAFLRLEIAVLHRRPPSGLVCSCRQIA